MWFSVVLYVIVVLLIIVWIYKYVTYKPPNFPKGPIRLPIAGSYLHCLVNDWNYPQVAVEKWTKAYGNIVGLHLGPYLTMIACDYETVKEVLVKPEFDGKPDMYAARIRALDQILGLFFTDGPKWHEQRRFSLRHMRDFGFGRRFEKLEILMEKELQAIVEYMSYSVKDSKERDICKDGNVYFPDILYPPMMNAIMSIFGMEPAAPGTNEYIEYRYLGRAIMLLQRGLYPFGGLSFAPWLRYIFPGIVGYNDILESNKTVFPLMRKIIQKLRNVEEDELTNFIDMYCKKMKENETELFSSFSDDQLLLLVIDYMFPALSAVPATIVFLLHYLVYYPNIQNRIHKEIDDVVGRGRFPTLNDRINLPFTEATIREVMRKDTLVPLGVPHRCLEDTQFRGYTIPQNTLVYTYLQGANMDKKIWGDPENFRPDRFIDESGKLKKKDYSLPFGAGKRLCAGETFARNSTFLIASFLLQNFTFKVPHGSPLPDIKYKHGSIINNSRNGIWIQADSRD